MQQLNTSVSCQITHKLHLTPVILLIHLTDIIIFLKTKLSWNFFTISAVKIYQKMSNFFLRVQQLKGSDKHHNALSYLLCIQICQNFGDVLNSF